jgi:hypothetical protein
MTGEPDPESRRASFSDISGNALPLMSEKDALLDSGSGSPVIVALLKRTPKSQDHCVYRMDAK